MLRTIADGLLAADERARQAGELAAKSGAKQFTIFHFSPRYLGQEDLLYQEATEAYERLS